MTGIHDQTASGHSRCQPIDELLEDAMSVDGVKANVLGHGFSRVSRGTVTPSRAPVLPLATARDREIASPHARGSGSFRRNSS